MTHEQIEDILYGAQQMCKRLNTLLSCIEQRTETFPTIVIGVPEYMNGMPTRWFIEHFSVHVNSILNAPILAVTLQKVDSIIRVKATFLYVARDMTEHAETLTGILLTVLSASIRDKTTGELETMSLLDEALEEQA